MATINPTVNLSGLARRLVMDGLLSEDDATAAHEAALKKRTHFVSYLVEHKILGSTAERVLRNAPCPVLIVPPVPPLEP